MKITAAVDGSAIGNPGPSGWAWYIDDDHWAAGGWPQGTNNKGELEAVRQLLHVMESVCDEQGVPVSLEIFCDSQYVINSVTTWVHGWKKKGWKKADGKPVVNVEQIKDIDQLLARRRRAGATVNFHWVKGHAGHELNEAADMRANAAATAYKRRQEPNRGPGYPQAVGATVVPATPAHSGSAGSVDSPGVGPADTEYGQSVLEFPTMKAMTRSSDLFAQARQLIPGGVNSPVRAFGSVGGTPLFIDSAQGSHLRDVDGNDYVDLVSSWGPMLHGNAHPAIVDAVRSAAAKGLSFGAPTAAENALAAEIISRTSVEEVRMVNSGTEATMSAVRLARGVTGRSTVLKFAGCYHGHVDSLLVSAGSGVATFGVPDSPGVTQSDTIVVPYNDLDAVREACEQHSDDIACIITEAAAGNMGTVAPAEGFNAALRDIAHEYGALLILDEVMTGFRTSYQGWYGVDGVVGDLVTFGKVVSGGLPAAAFGGRRDLMAYLAPEGPVYQAGTLSGNPVAMAAGLASLRLADDECYATLRTNADRLAGLLHEALDREGVAHHIQRAATFLSVRFADGEGHNFVDMRAADTFRYAPFFHALLDNGVYTAPSAFETWFVSTALTDEDFSRIESALRPAAKAAAAATKEG